MLRTADATLSGCSLINLRSSATTRLEAIAGTAADDVIFGLAVDVLGEGGITHTPTASRFV